MTRVSAIITATLATIGWAVAAELPPPAAKVGNEVSTHSSEVAPEPGRYKPLTFWTKVKLGSAYYTNPAITQNLDFAYRYDPKELARDGKQEKIWQLANEGRLTLGIAHGTGATIEPTEELLRDFDISNETTFNTALQSGQVIVFSSEKTLLGSNATETLVKEGMSPLTQSQTSPKTSSPLLTR